MTPADLRAAIAPLGLTQAQAAALLGVHIRTLRHWLTGDRDIPKTVRRLLLAIERDRSLVDVLREMPEPF